MSFVQKLSYSIFVLLISGLILMSSQFKLPVLDEAADQYFIDSVQNATVAYATLRGVNAVVSVIKESSVEVSPAGVGLSLAAGQMLDPIDDMTERASSVVVMALVSLGIQKIGYEVGQVVSFQLLAAGIVALLPFIWLNRLSHHWVKRLFMIGVVLLALRFLLPAFAGLSGWLHQGYFAIQQQQALDQLSFISDQQVSLKELWSSDKDQSWWSRLYGEEASSSQWFLTLNELVNQLDVVIGALIQLMMLFILEWLLQVIALPVLAIFILYQLMKQSWASINKHA